MVEAVLTVAQPQASGSASFPLTCTGSFALFGVAVEAVGGTFELGEAQANGTVVIKRGRTDRAEDTKTVTIQPTVFVDIADNAQLEGGGSALMIDVTVACPVGASGDDSRLGVSQGQATGHGIYFPVCDGTLHTLAVHVQATRGSFVAGSAQAGTFALIAWRDQGFGGFDEQFVRIEP